MIGPLPVLTFQEKMLHYQSRLLLYWARGVTQYLLLMMSRFQMVYAQVRFHDKRRL